MNKRNDRRSNKRDVAEKPLKERVQVWTLLQHKAPQSTLDFEWPEIVSDKERIKYNTKKYADVSISEAFGGAYREDEPEVPLTLRYGDVIDVKIASIEKGEVKFQGLIAKETVICKNNLAKYAKLRHYLPLDPIKARVISADRKQVCVDVLLPMLDQWIVGTMEDVDKQRNMANPQVVMVHDLQLTRGGYMGKINVPTIEEFVGEPYYVDAFIPGSQIVLNIENDFERWVGKDVMAFVTGYSPKPNMPTKMSVICSPKAYLTFLGDMTLVDMFSHYCSIDDEWKAASEVIYDGVVTGILNSTRKCGAFVEITSMNLTGMADVAPEELVNYQPGQEVKVKISGFDDMTYFDSDSGQRKHMEPYEIENGVLKSCILKPTLKLV